MRENKRSPKRQAAIDAGKDLIETRRQLYEAHANGLSWSDAAKVVMGGEPAKKKAMPGKPFFSKPEPSKDEAKVVAVKARVQTERPEPAVLPKVDDLTKIRGIGSGTVRKLGSMGVTMFAQIAGWSSRDVEKFDEELGYRGRIDREDWVGQAKMLLAEEAGE